MIAMGKTKDVGKLVNELVELGLDMLEAYDAAMDRVDDLDDRARFDVLCKEHERQVHDLQLLATELGTKPAVMADFRRVLTKGKVVLASLIGDRLVLLAMKDNEEDVVRAYERALERTDLSSLVRDILARFRDEERQHVTTLEQRLIEFDEVEVESYVPPNAPRAEESPPSRT